jgi:GT2 family glycosyltransferase
MSSNNTSLPLVSVIVLNWNGKRFIDPLMKTFLAQSYPRDRLELLYVDNGSTDDSIDYFNKHYSTYEFAKVIATGHNYGYAGGNDIGMKHATGDYILIANSDLEFDKNMIAEMVKSAQKTKADVTSAKLMFLNKPGIINNAGSRLEPGSDWPIYEIGMDEKDTGQYDKDYEITAFCGACILIRRDFLQTVGMFDKRFFLYFEDGDLSWRGQRAGKHYFLAGKAIAKHFHVGSGGGEGSPVFNHYVGRNRLLILAKNAKFKVFLKGVAKTLRDQLLLRVKRLWLALLRKYPRRLALKEFWASQKMLWDTLFLLPYAWCKRFGIIKEETL